MPWRRQSSASFAPASYSLTIPMICSSVNRLVRICPPPERRSNRFPLSMAPFQGAGSPPSWHLLPQRGEHGLRRTADHPEARKFFLPGAFFIGFLEVLGNCYFFSPGSDFGLLGAF